MKLLSLLLVIFSLLIVGIADSQIIQFSGAGGTTGGGGVPVVLASQLFPIHAPAPNGSTVGEITASNSPTSFAVTSCSGCENYFIPDTAHGRPDRLIVTATGAANILGSPSPTTYSPIITATNPAGPSTGVTVSVVAYADPVVGTLSGFVNIPTVVGANVGDVSIDNGGVTTAAFTTCTGPNTPCTGFFNATTAGVVTVTSDGAKSTGLKTGTYNLTLTATNLLGRTGSNNTISVDVSPSNPSTVSTQTIIISSPVLAVANIGTPVTATNPPAAFSVTSCAIGAAPTACNGWFTINSSSGQMSITPTGVTHINGTSDKATYLPVVAADNGAGTVGTGTQTVVAYADGKTQAVAAASCTGGIPRPTIISTPPPPPYVATPPWKVAGVDYCVGTSGTNFTNPVVGASQLRLSFCFVDGPNHTVNCSGGAASGLIANYDFTGYTVTCGGSGFNFTNNKFGSFVGLSACTNLQFKNNDMNGGSFQTSGQTPTIKYNRFRNSPVDAIQLLGGNASIRYNLIDTTGTSGGGNWIELGTGQYTLGVEFNTVYQPTPGGGTNHGISLITGTLVGANDIGYNTMIANTGANIDYDVKINLANLTGSIVTHDNYVDLNGSSVFGAAGSATNAGGFGITSELGARPLLTSETGAKLTIP